MDQEKIETLKYLLIGGFCSIIGGIILNILLMRTSPLLAKICNIGGIGLGILIMGGGVIYMTAGDKLQARFGSTPMTEEERKRKFDEEFRQKQAILSKLKMDTEIKMEQAKHQAIQNKLAMQKAQINKMSQSSGGKGGVPDILGNLGGMLNSNVGSMDSYAIRKNDYKDRLKKKDYDFAKPKNMKDYTIKQGSSNGFVIKVEQQQAKKKAKPVKQQHNEYDYFFNH